MRYEIIEAAQNSPCLRCDNSAIELLARTLLHRARPAPASAKVVPTAGLPAIGSSLDGVNMRTLRVGPGNLRRKYERGFGGSHFICDPLNLLFVNSLRIEEHGQLVAREWLIRKNIEMD